MRESVFNLPTTFFTHDDRRLSTINARTATANMVQEKSGDDCRIPLKYEPQRASTVCGIMRCGMIGGDDVKQSFHFPMSETIHGINDLYQGDQNLSVRISGSDKTLALKIHETPLDTIFVCEENNVRHLEKRVAVVAYSKLVVSKKTYVNNVFRIYRCQLEDLHFSRSFLSSAFCACCARL